MLLLFYHIYLVLNFNFNFLFSVFWYTLYNKSLSLEDPQEETFAISRMEIIVVFSFSQELFHEWLTKAKLWLGFMLRTKANPSKIVKMKKCKGFRKRKNFANYGKNSLIGRIAKFWGHFSYTHIFFFKKLVKGSSTGSFLIFLPILPFKCQSRIYTLWHLPTGNCL